MNPRATGTQVQPGIQFSLVIASAGESRLQKLAASITPAVKPSIMSSMLRLKSLKKKTTAAPKAVRNHAKQAAMKPCMRGCKVSKNSMTGFISDQGA